MFNLDILVSYQQIQYIPTDQEYIDLFGYIPEDQYYIKLDHIPLINSIWFAVEKEKNIVLSSYDTYDGYDFYKNEDIKINYIKEPNTIYDSPVPNLNYLDIDSDKDIIKKYNGCLINTICTKYTEVETEVYVLQSDIYDESGNIREDSIDFYLKNLCGKCFIDWSSSEQIKNIISGKTIQINYWYHPEK